jgi:hypothetical protein
MTFYWKFVDTLAYNIATICAIIVGVSQFLIKSFNENDGETKVRKFINKTLHFVNQFTSFVYNQVNKDTLPEVKKTQRCASK